MAAIGPFESSPRLAVGLSGGADSLALVILMDGWARERGGSVTALTVDHGLRRESEAEARAVGRLMLGLGIAHKRLTWRGEKPTSNLQAEARLARRRLLLDWCEKEGVLHLALAHQADDQAETVILNLTRGSGLDGLAGMAALAEAGEARILRPLLGVPRSRLEALLRTRGLDWIEDPSNRDPRFTRAQLRQALPDLAGGLGLAPDLLQRRLADAAGHLARVRSALETDVAALLASCSRLDPAGVLWLDRNAILEASEEIGLRALARCLATIGGRDYPPRFDRLTALRDRLASPGFRGGTLGGCRIVARQEALLLVREARGQVSLAPVPDRGLWDGRFRFRLTSGAGRGWCLKALGRGPFPKGLKMGGNSNLPGVARQSLPAFFDAQETAAGPIAVPQLGFFRDSAVRSAIRGCHFAPRASLIGPGFTVA